MANIGVKKQHRIPTLLVISLLMLLAAVTAKFMKSEPNLNQWPSNTELKLDENGRVSWVTSNVEEQHRGHE